MDTLTSNQRSFRMGLIRSENTTPERAVQDMVRNCGVDFKAHVCGLPGRPDIVIFSRRKIVLVHGCFWHRHRCKAGRRMPKTNQEYWTQKFCRNRQRDSKVSNQLQSIGWDVLVVWECQLRGVEKLKDRIREFLGKLGDPLPAGRALSSPATSGLRTIYRSRTHWGIKCFHPRRLILEHDGYTHDAYIYENCFPPPRHLWPRPTRLPDS